MELLLFILLFALTFATLLLINYFRKIFMRQQEEILKSEIIFPHQYILGELNSLLNPKSVNAIIFLSVGTLLGLMLAHTGAVYGDHREDFIFNSALYPVLLFLSLPYLQSHLEGKAWTLQNPGKAVYEGLLSGNTVFFSGISAAVMAQAVSLLVMNHLNIVWVGINNSVIAGLVLYKMYKDDNTIKENTLNSLENDEENTI